MPRRHRAFVRVWKAHDGAPQRPHRVWDSDLARLCRFLTFMNHTQTMNHMPDLKMSPHLTALRCLFLVALHHGIQLRPEVLASADDSDTLSSVMRLMREIGL